MKDKLKDEDDIPLKGTKARRKFFKELSIDIADEVVQDFFGWGTIMSREQRLIAEAVGEKLEASCKN